MGSISEQTFEQLCEIGSRRQERDEFRPQRLTRFAEELRIGKRPEKVGEVRVSKHIETEQVKQSVPLQREQVRVERRSAQKGGWVGAEAVLEKRPFVRHL
jgi:stress response protein YsnF